MAHASGIRADGSPPAKAPEVKFGFSVGAEFFTYPGNIKCHVYGGHPVYFAIDRHTMDEISGCADGEFKESFFEYYNQGRLETIKEGAVLSLKVPRTDPRPYATKVPSTHPDFPKIEGELYVVPYFSANPHGADGSIKTAVLSGAAAAGLSKLATLRFYATYEDALIMKAVAELKRGNPKDAASDAGRARASLAVHKGVEAALGSREPEEKPKTALAWLHDAEKQVRAKEKAADAASASAGGRKR